MFKVLSLVANTRPQQPCAPLIDSLADDTMLQFSPGEDKALHWKSFLFISAGVWK